MNTHPHPKIALEPHIHAVFFAAFAGLGAFVHNFERSQLEKLEFERDKLVKRRMMRVEAEAAEWVRSVACQRYVVGRMVIQQKSIHTTHYITN